MSSEKTRLLKPAEKKKIFELRCQGMTINAIAHEIGRSDKAVQTTLKQSPVDMSSITRAVLREAAQEIGERVDVQFLADVALRQTVRLLTASDRLHDLMETASTIATSEPEKFGVISRGVAAQSAALTNLLKTYSGILPMQQDNIIEKELPELKICFMDAQDVREMRQQQKSEAELMGGLAGA